MSLVLERVQIVAAAGALFAPLDLRIAPGEVATVMGASGAGKSTLLDAIAGHLAPGFRLAGRIRLNGRDLAGLPPEARKVGLMMQQPVLFAHLNLGDNLGFGLPAQVRGRAARRAAVAAALDQAGLAGLHDRDPASLSGGQRSRAALMRTLLAEPAALLLDEPFSSLDAPLRADMRRFVFDHVRSRGIPALLVTHDPADSEAAGGAVLHLTTGGRDAPGV